MHLLTRNLNCLVTRCRSSSSIDAGASGSVASLRQCCQVELVELLPSCSPSERNHKDLDQENMGATWSKTCLKSTYPGMSPPAKRVPILKYGLELHLAWRWSSGHLQKLQEKFPSAYQHSVFLQSLPRKYQSLQKNAGQKLPSMSTFTKQ